LQRQPRFADPGRAGESQQTRLCPEQACVQRRHGGVSSDERCRLRRQVSGRMKGRTPRRSIVRWL
jgi:hypothetical protein